MRRSCLVMKYTVYELGRECKEMKGIRKESYEIRGKMTGMQDDGNLQDGKGK